MKFQVLRSVVLFVFFNIRKMIRDRWIKYGMLLSQNVSISNKQSIFDMFRLVSTGYFVSGGAGSGPVETGQSCQVQHSRKELQHTVNITFGYK